MTINSEVVSEPQESPPESLRTLAAHLERALDAGRNVVLMRRDADSFSVCLGNPENEDDKLKSLGTLTASTVNEILESTRAGANRLSVGDEEYRFFRSFTQIDNVGAVVFAPA
jgi:hypothetical protein